MTPALKQLQSYLTTEIQCGVCNRHVDNVQIDQSTSTLTLELRFYCHGDLETQVVDTTFFTFFKVSR